jgi:hypothetical protein
MVQFLTSSEGIGNCIALRKFVSWCLPSLLNDETIMLADISMKGVTHVWHQRAQLWMVAAELDNCPVLTVNSVEFNNEGAKHIDRLLPAVVEVLQDVALRAGFQRIFVGISDFGRHWFDSRYSQKVATDPISKIHSRDLGYSYYFDAYRIRWKLTGRHYEYMTSRTLLACLYALTFGIIEFSTGRFAKAAAFLDSASNRRNCWEIPL